LAKIEPLITSTRSLFKSSGPRQRCNLSEHGVGIGADEIRQRDRADSSSAVAKEIAPRLDVAKLLKIHISILC